MWVLILTLVAKPDQPGAAIAIAEFSSATRCKIAAKTWLEDHRKIPDRVNPGNKIYFSAVCSPK